MSTIASPCTRVCVIDPESRLCQGCARSLDEIAGWAGFTEARRRAVMAELPARRAVVAELPARRAVGAVARPRIAPT